MSGIQFTPWSSDIELAFYAALASLKINHDKLDDSARRILGLYEIRPEDAPERSCRMQIYGNALTSDAVPQNYHRAEGIIKNVNTIEEFRNLDRPAMIERAGQTIWDAIRDGTIYSCPSLLSSFYVISFANLKKYKFFYHFAFPALHSEPPWVHAAGTETRGLKLGPKETTALVEAVQTWKYRVDSRQHGFFLAKRMRGFRLDEMEEELPEKEERYESGEHEVPQGEDESAVDEDKAETQELAPETPLTPGPEELGFVWKIASLSSYEGGFFKDVDPEDRFVCFADPSTYAENPGWMMRNLLVLVRQRWHLDEVRILCYRDTHLRRDQAKSIILDLAASKLTNTAAEAAEAPNLPKITGWERNESNKINNRMVDLAEYMDPRRLADQSVDLNLKLMKWRIAPTLDLDAIKETKCLLLGAGTLGSYVARNLLGWGVRKITFVDSANVSFSNPVRQPLFAFKDCVDGGAKKALRAAEALAEIYPGVDAEGYVLSVPMAGHPIIEEEKVRGEFEMLKRLIDEHDAVFLLMDTRESRWLPTVMGKAADKIVMNAALGFDTFVVMRHGLRGSGMGQGEEELGCYFCNDVVAPADSIKDQTLDQQCTVTRPGIAAIASALLVELLVSILQHPLRARAPASTSTSTTSSSSPFPSSFPPNPPSTSSTSPSRPPFTHPLGLLPHQLRGFLSSFSTLLIRGAAYDSCSACSARIVDRYRKEGWEFVKRALNERGWVEEVSGLAEVQRRAEEVEAEGGCEWSEGEEEIGGGGDPGHERGWVEEVSGLAEVQRRAEEVEAEGGCEWSEGEEGKTEIA